jgi:hypothetical protein
MQHHPRFEGTVQQARRNARQATTCKAANRIVVPHIILLVVLHIILLVVLHIILLVLHIILLVVLHIILIEVLHIVLLLGNIVAVLFK